MYPYQARNVFVFILKYMLTMFNGSFSPCRYLLAKLYAISVVEKGTDLYFSIIVEVFTGFVINSVTFELTTPYVLHFSNYFDDVIINFVTLRLRYSRTTTWIYKWKRSEKVLIFYISRVIAILQNCFIKKLKFVEISNRFCSHLPSILCGIRIHCSHGR